MSINATAQRSLFRLGLIGSLMKCGIICNEKYGSFFLELINEYVVFTGYEFPMNEYDLFNVILK